MTEAKSTFETLEVWIKSRDLRNNISKLTKRFPKVEFYKLSDQMIHAFRPVTANIAEGLGRFHYQENIQFNRQARGSLYELPDHLTVAFDEIAMIKKSPIGMNIYLWLFHLTIIKQITYR